MHYEPDETINHIAKALVKSWNDRNGHKESFDDLDEARKEFARADARAAIDAIWEMRERMFEDWKSLKL